MKTNDQWGTRLLVTSDVPGSLDHLLQSFLMLIHADLLSRLSCFQWGCFLPLECTIRNLYHCLYLTINSWCTSLFQFPGRWILPFCQSRRRLTEPQNLSFGVPLHTRRVKDLSASRLGTEDKCNFIKCRIICVKKSFFLSKNSLF